MTASDIPRIGRIAAMIPVTDIERSIVFYGAVFGLEVTFRNGSPTGFAILRRDSAELHLTLDRNHRATTNNVAHVIVDKVDEIYARFRANGSRIIKDLRDHDFGLRAFVATDPDGNRLDIGQPLPPKT
jgi:lactoylglutathione lyase